MTDELTVDGKVYISSKRAAQLSQYTQDYVGQLARAGHVDAHRIGGLWYVFMDSLNAYKLKAEAYVPKPPGQSQYENRPTDTLVTFDGHDYVSAARASEITGYNQDYVGQLARTGKILSRQVGNRWYVHREGLLAHKEEKDRLLGAVQTEAVGIPAALAQVKERVVGHKEPLLTYNSENKALLPVLGHDNDMSTRSEKLIHQRMVLTEEEHPESVRGTGYSRDLDKEIIPIRLTSRLAVRKEILSRRKSMSPPKMISFIVGILLSATLGTVLFHMDGRLSGSPISQNTLVRVAGDLLEPFVTTELVYRK